MYNILKELLESTVSFIDKNFQDKQIAFDCNSDYGQVFVSVNSKPQNVTKQDVLGEQAEDFFWFGDWEFPDVRAVCSEIDKVWEDKWSKYQEIIRDDWMDLSNFEEKFNRQIFLEKICRIAANFNREIPILVADHDEHLSYSLKRLRNAYFHRNNLQETFLTSKKWLSKDDSDFLNYLAFFTNGKFVNTCQFLDGNNDEIVFEGEWCRAKKELSMTLCETNIEGFNECGREDKYIILELNENILNYKDSEQEWNFKKSD